jgi:hypothetical protein|tara:strand:+ start:6795 stop:6995 length:201 start_codon:yes stop_codon:yes gene_type:complete
MDKKIKLTFKAPTFMEYFNTFEDDVLVEMAQHYPESLKRMCALITLDAQIEKERLIKGPSMDEYLA